MKILYYDCFAGISGDMNLGALIDLGVDVGYLKNELAKLQVHGFELIVNKDVKNGIQGTRAHIKTSEQHKHRNLKDINEIIDNSGLSDYVISTSKQIFRLIAEAEAKIHGKSIQQIHFHEVGALDSIADIVGAAVCLDYLKPDKIICSTVEVGGGFVECAHGTFPVPAPASAEILKNIPLKTGAVNFETTTPTGAAILAACTDEFSDKKSFKISKIGYGIGFLDFKIPNVLRVLLADDTGDQGSEGSPAMIVECNIDDMNPEYYEHIMEKLFNEGAHDVYITPIIMKKSRPAQKLTVLCSEQDEKEIEGILLKETSTLGVRKYRVDKTMLERKYKTIKTRFGEVTIKSAFLNGELIKSKPEYNDCLRIAREQNMSLWQVYQFIEKENK